MRAILCNYKLSGAKLVCMFLFLFCCALIKMKCSWVSNTQHPNLTEPFQLQAMDHSCLSIIPKIWNKQMEINQMELTLRFQQFLKTCDTTDFSHLDRYFLYTHILPWKKGTKTNRSGSQELGLISAVLFAQHIKIFIFLVSSQAGILSQWSLQRRLLSPTMFI